MDKDKIRLKRFISRRRFLTVSSLSVAAGGGWWLSNSNQFLPRVFRGWLAETGRSIAPPPHRPTPSQWDPNKVTLSWLGHSTVLINFYGIHILTDPALKSRVGAHVGFGTIGPKRLVAPALDGSELPKIDLVLISHAHMDHLDFATLRQLPNRPPVITARATADLFRNTGFTQVHELGWDDGANIQTAQGTAQVHAFEVNHWGARWRRDTHRGYNGYILEREGRKILFGGDTANSDSFGGLKGPFDIACMPIGAYSPWVCSHCTPEEALTMANAARARYFVPIHHKTFPLGREGPIEPLERLEAALTKESDRLALRQIGETFQLPG